MSNVVGMILRKGWGLRVTMNVFHDRPVLIVDEIDRIESDNVGMCTPHQHGYIGQYPILVSLIVEPELLDEHFVV